MQDRHERDRTESIMLGPAFQTSWVIEKLHDKSRMLPDPDIFTLDSAETECCKRACRVESAVLRATTATRIQGKNCVSVNL